MIRFHMVRIFAATNHQLMKHITVFITLVAWLSVTAFSQQAAQELVKQQLAELPAFMERGMESWGIPGMAVAVVHQGEMVYARGFGMRKSDSNDPVDENTIFGMASLTKAMTATALAILVDDGKLHWNDRVRDHLPWFELSDPWISDRVTISDLLSHQVGIGRMTGNRLRFMPGRDPQTIMGFLKQQPFEADFRSGYVYSNMMYMVAGLVIEAVSGMSWNDYMTEHLFQPLGMNSARTSITQIAEQDNIAFPHQEINDEVIVIPKRNFDNVGPAASVMASVSDMAKWMMLNLDTPGVYKGQEIVSLEQMKAIFQPRQRIPLEDPFTEKITSYGYGWGLRHYEGYRIAQHSGATDGMTSLLVLVPEEELGIIIASNLFCNFRPAVRNYILDAFLEIDRDKDWHDHYFNQFEKDKKEALERRAEIESKRVHGTTPTLPLKAYVGKFHHPVYDNAEVSLDDKGQLVMQLWDDDEMIADLEHWHHDTFRAHWRNPAMREKFITFDLDQFGEVKQLNVKFTLRQILISAGIYPADYYRIVEYKKNH